MSGIRRRGAGVMSDVESEIERTFSFEELQSSKSFPEITAQAYRDAAAFLWKRADRSERDGLQMCGLSTHYARYIALLCQRALSSNGVHD